MIFANSTKPKSDTEGHNQGTKEKKKLSLFVFLIKLSDEKYIGTSLS